MLVPLTAEVHLKLLKVSWSWVKLKIMCLFYIVEMKATNERLCKDNNYGMGDIDSI